MHDYTLSHTGVYLSLKGTIYANNSFISTTEIGVTSPNTDQNEGLQCITDKKRCCRSGSSLVGEWFFPSGTVVPGQGTGPTFYRNRGLNDDGTVNLNRVNTNDMMPTGLFCCVVPDATDVMWWTCANVCELVVDVDSYRLLLSFLFQPPPLLSR